MGEAMVSLASAIVETMGQPVLVLENDHTVAMANKAFLTCFRVSSKETVGERLFDLGNGQWDIPDLRQMLTQLLAGRDRMEEYRVEHEFAAIGKRIMLLNAARLEQEGFERILLAISDITEVERAREEVVARQELADKLVDSIREGLVVLRPDLRVDRVNQSFCDMFQVDADATAGVVLYEIGNGQWDIPELRRALEEVLSRQSAFDDYEVTHAFPGIGRRTMMLNGRRLDHMPLILLAIRDETERRRHAEEQALMVGELQHRVKNILANVQALASATLRRSASLAEFKTSYLQRLQALARAQDLLMRGARGTVELDRLIRFELEAHGWEVDSRLAIDGPRVVLTRIQTPPIAMVIHELATNAVKYGAFAGSRGRLDVRWTVGDDLWLRLGWIESGVPIDGPAPARGFGTRMIENSVGHSLGGETRLTFEEGGLACHIAFPLDRDVQGAQ